MAQSNTYQKQRQTQNPHDEKYIQQENHHLRTDRGLSNGGGGLNAF